MRYLDFTFPTPEHNLACDEALLDLCEDGCNYEILRFWEPNKHFIVLGYSGKINSEVNVSSCRKKKIPILRRPSGGGTVLQGPGCLNFSLVLKIGASRAIQNISETNAYVLAHHSEAFKAMSKGAISIQGLSDLTRGTLKFSGNAQRRKKRSVLFHGTFLLDLDFSLMEELLPLPPKQPAYRKNRSHRDFLTNLNLSSSVIKEALRNSWKADTPLEPIPIPQIEALVQNRYGTEAWNLKF